MIKSTKEVNKRVSPPFLNSFNASATILSYVGNSCEVASMLKHLSKSASKYWRGHRAIINGFLKGSSITRILKFGGTRRNVFSKESLQEPKRALEFYTKRSFGEFDLSSVCCSWKHDRLLAITLGFQNFYRVSTGCNKGCTDSQEAKITREVKYISARVFENQWPDLHNPDQTNK